jgi:hypothetical protein
MSYVRMDKWDEEAVKWFENKNEKAAANAWVVWLTNHGTEDVPVGWVQGRRRLDQSSCRKSIQTIFKDIQAKSSMMGLDEEDYWS